MLKTCMHCNHFLYDYSSKFYNKKHNGTCLIAGIEKNSKVQKLPLRENSGRDGDHVDGTGPFGALCLGYEIQNEQSGLESGMG